MNVRIGKEGVAYLASIDWLIVWLGNYIHKNLMFKTQHKAI